MPAHAQQGTELLVQAPPTFTGYTVVGSTWEESDATQSEETMNQDEETFNVSFWNPGRNASCTLVTSAGTLAPDVGTKLTEEGEDGRDWLVTASRVTNFGSRALKYQVTLIYREALNLT